MGLLLSVHLLKSDGGLLVAGELDEAEAAGAHGLTVLDDNLEWRSDVRERGGIRMR